VKTIKGLLVDLDGVLVKGKAMDPFPDTRDFIAFLRERNIAFRIVTNNSMKTPSGIARRLGENGIFVFEEEIISPMAICPRVLQEQKIEKVFVLGSEGLKQHLASMDFSIKTDAAVDAVLVAQDRTLNFEEIKTAVTAIKKYGAGLFAMNDNRIILDDDGMLFAGAGAICRMLMYAAGYEASPVHFGKMGEIYNQILFEQFHEEKRTLAIISDDLYTDIKGYQAKGLMGIFLTTGKYGKEDITGGMEPDVVLKSLTEVAAFLKGR